MLLYKIWKSGSIQKEILWIIKVLFVIFVSFWGLLNSTLSFEITAFIFFFIFIFLPSLLSNQLRTKAMFSGNFKWAYWLSLVAYILHPNDTFKFFPKYQKKILNLSENQNTDELIEEARKIFSSTINPTSVVNYTSLLGLLSQWNLLYEIISDKHLPPLLYQSSLILKLQAACELGDIQKIQETYLDFKKNSPIYSDDQRDFTYLLISAALGNVELTHHFLNSSLNSLSAEKKLYYLAVAERFSQPEKSKVIFEKLSLIKNDFILQKRAKTRLAQEPDKILSDDISVPLLQEVKLYVLARRLIPNNSKPIITWLFVGLIGFVFLFDSVLSKLTDSNNPLVILGMIWPQRMFVLNEWWRLFTANFLHMGLLHLLMNSMALLSIGPLIENQLSRIKYFYLLILLSLLSLSSVTFINYYLNRDQFIVGASGIIMGLIGWELISAFRNWKQLNHQETKKILLNWLTVVGIQFSIDFFVKEISSLGHISGFLWGVLLNLILNSKSNN